MKKAMMPPKEIVTEPTFHELFISPKNQLPTASENPKETNIDLIDRFDFRIPKEQMFCK